MSVLPCMWILIQQKQVKIAFENFFKLRQKLLIHYASLIIYAVCQLFAFRLSLYHHQTGFRSDIQETDIFEDCRLASCQFNYT